MAKVFIPQIGDKIELSQNWNCKVFNERRNSSVFEALGVDVSNQKDSNIDITFLKGTVFKVTRLYVRAPASSYDSITLAVVSSPIKKLVKAKFWVKIMDANNMEFEVKEYKFEDFDKISSLLRDIVLKDGHSNDNKLTTLEKQAYLQQIISHFTKPEKVIFFEIKLLKEDIFSTFQLRSRNDSWHRDNGDYDREKALIENELPDEVIVKYTAHPLLNGIIYKSDIVESIKIIDEKLGYFNQYSSDYWNKKRLGSFLSYDLFYFVDNIKKDKIWGVLEAYDQKVDFNIGGVIQKIKNQTAFNKIVTSLM